MPSITKKSFVIIATEANQDALESLFDLTRKDAFIDVSDSLIKIADEYSDKAKASKEPMDSVIFQAQAVAFHDAARGILDATVRKQYKS